jgi:hypothetical protein
VLAHHVLQFVFLFSFRGNGAPYESFV